MFSCSAVGQEVTRRSEMVTTEFVSDSGNIVSFTLIVSGKTYLIVRDLSRSEEYKFEIGLRKVFLTDTVGWVFNIAKKELYHIDFKNRQLHTITDVTHLEFLHYENKLVFKNHKTNTLTIMDMMTRKSIEILNVSSFSLSPDSKRIVAVKSNNEYVVWDLKTNKNYIIPRFDSQNHRVKKIVFGKSNSELYLVANAHKDISVYALRKNEFTKVGSYPIVNEIEKTVIDTLFHSVRLLTGNQLIIGVKPQVINTKSDAADVQVWTGSQKGFSPNVEFQKNATNQIALVNVKTGKWLSLADPEVNMIFKIDDRDQIYSFDMFETDSLGRLDPLVTVSKYKNLEKRNKILNSVSSKGSNILSFKHFDSLVYFWNSNWYYYDDVKGKAVSITKNLMADFYSKDVLYSNETTNNPVALPLEWKNKGIFFTSDTDLWLFDNRSKTIRKKTNGVEKGRSYRISQSNYEMFSENWSWSAVPKNINNYLDLVLNWYSDMYTTQGLALLDKDEQIIDLTQDKALYTQVKRSNNHIIYIKEKANSTPKLYLYDIIKRTEQLIYNTNTYDTEVENVVSEYISWKKKDGKLAGGILRFPKNYKPDTSEKYPVVVYIYEKKYRSQHSYYSPEDFSVSKINFRPFVADNYFVLEPDIYYEVGHTGDSALKSVTEAIDTLSQKYPLDTSRMGIYGHSFGGYQTNYIITHSDRFKAAVSSAGVADIVSEYFNYSNSSKRPNFWRYENHQFRLEKNFYQDKERYFRNSPIYYAESVTTPLLLVTGDKDYVVNWQQSLLMFNALKKLNKEVALLIYIDEDHQILKNKNQKDVSTKVKQWFDHYLKDEKIPEWSE